MPVVQLKNFQFEHILEWEEGSIRTIARKRVIGRQTPTPEAEVYVTMPREIVIRARVTSPEKTQLWSLFNECAWHQLTEDGSLIDYVWMEKPNFRWDSGLGCGPRPWIATLGLVCSSS